MWSNVASWLLHLLSLYWIVYHGAYNTEYNPEPKSVGYLKFVSLWLLLMYIVSLLQFASFPAFYPPVNRLHGSNNGALAVDNLDRGVSIQDRHLLNDTVITPAKVNLASTTKSQALDAAASPLLGNSRAG